MVALLSVGVGTAVIVGGVLLVVLAVMVARGFARLERFRLRTWLGRGVASPSYRRVQAVIRYLRLSQ